jgi:amidase
LGIAPGAYDGAEHTDVQDALSRAAEAARSAGIEIVEVEAPNVPRICEIFGQILFTEADITMRPTLEKTGSPEMQGWMNSFTEHFGLLSLEGYMDALTERMAMQRSWALMFQNIDALLLPVSLVPPFENDLDFKAPDRAGEIIRAQAPLYTVNLLGLPSLALPTHVAGGLPLGVQIVGPIHDDDAVLEIGMAVERELGIVLRQMPARYRL